ncbi:Hpt domain-containing protein [Candidatus Kryptonium thompsonii]|jgi:HPt (histidine-containing phosphotransfer) domain-containing protein|uniref:Hpt domain-containing protein n=1 Tax=Candidatus Kryptonium thompsonii TaxID=1633631 RepID=UPI000707E21F|nr:Hpt domain-containing protein [Candidatus Kryptonium thompsoni]CUS88433.1 Hpt domain-containing protein [Candidatus Kryptonium thompsoni]
MGDIPADEWKKLIKFFIDTAEEKVNQMKKALETKDLKVIQLYAHQLKGSGEAFGFQEITEISKLIEQKCILDSCSDDELCKMIQKLSDTIEKFKSGYIN